MTRLTEPGICRFVDSNCKKFEEDGVPGHQRAAFKHTKERRDSDTGAIDQALRKRLDQLRASMGDQATTGELESAPLRLKAPTAPAPPRRFRGRTVLASSLVSACLGAAVAWNVAVASGGASASAPVAQQEWASARIPNAPMASGPTSAALDVLPAAPHQTVEAQLNQMLESWRQAWSSRDVDAYLGHYSGSFAPQGGQTRPAWAEARRKNIAGRTSISIEVRSLRIERVDPDRFKVAFLQDYASGNYREVAQPKVLELVREGPTWRIVSERQSVG